MKKVASGAKPSSRKTTRQVQGGLRSFRGLDAAAAGALLGAYFLGTFLLLPRSETVVSILVGLFVFGAVVLVSKTIGPRSTPAFSLLGVSGVSGLLLFWATMPLDSPYDAPLAFVGMHGSVLLWAALRWKANERSEFRAPFRLILLIALLGAAGLCLIATVPILIGVFQGESQLTTVIWVYLAYFGGATSAGASYWLLQGVSHRPVGLYLLGTLAGFCMYAAIGPIAAVLDGEPVNLREVLAGGLVIGSLVGPPVAFKLREYFA